MLELRTAWLERLGIPYFMLLAPNAISVYPEKRPEGYDIVEDRPINQLIGHLQETGSFASVIMPVQELIEARQERLTYIPTDTHWNEFGAFVAYEVLMAEMERRGVEARRLRRDDLGSPRTSTPETSASKVDPPITSTHVLAEPRAPSARMVADNRIYNSGQERRVRVRPGTRPLLRPWRLLRLHHAALHGRSRSGASSSCTDRPSTTRRSCPSARAPS